MQRQTKKLFSSKILGPDDLKLIEVNRINNDIQEHSGLIENSWKEEILRNANTYNGDIVEFINVIQKNPEEILIEYSPVKYKDLIGLKKLSDELNRDFGHISIGGLLHNKTSYLFEDIGENELRLIGGIVEIMNGKLNLRENILKEIEEELGLSQNEIKITNGILGFQTEQGNLIIVCNIEITLDDIEIMNKYKKLRYKELREIAFIKKDNIIEKLNLQGRYFPYLIDLIT